MIKRQEVRKFVANVNGINFEKNRQRSFWILKRHLIDDDKYITDHKEIKACICKFYKNLFKKTVSKSDSGKESFLNRIVLPNLTSKRFDICESEIAEKRPNNST